MSSSFQSKIIHNSQQQVAKDTYERQFQDRNCTTGYPPGGEPACAFEVHLAGRRLTRLSADMGTVVLVTVYQVPQFMPPSFESCVAVYRGLGLFSVLPHLRAVLLHEEPWETYVDIGKYLLF
jgi:hypothetical protein